jgi:hypothetical protein
LSAFLFAAAAEGIAVGGSRGRLLGLALKGRN